VYLESLSTSSAKPAGTLVNEDHSPSKSSVESVSRLGNFKLSLYSWSPTYKNVPLFTAVNICWLLFPPAPPAGSSASQLIFPDDMFHHIDSSNTANMNSVVLLVSHESPLSRQDHITESGPTVVALNLRTSFPNDLAFVQHDEDIVMFVCESESFTSHREPERYLSGKV